MIVTMNWIYYSLPKHLIKLTMQHHLRNKGYIQRYFVGIKNLESYFSDGDKSNYKSKLLIYVAAMICIKITI